MEAPLGTGDHGVGFQPQFANPIPISWQRAIFTAITSGLLSLIATVPLAGQNCIEYTDYLHFVASLDTPGHPVGVAVNGDHAYVADADPDDDSSNLLVLDIATAMPEIVGSVETAGAAQDVAFDGIFAYVVSSSSFQVVDVSIPSSPVIVGSVNSIYGRSMVVAGNYAYVATYTIPGRLDIIDISNPALPAIIGSVSVETPLQTVDVAVAGTYAYVATGFCDDEMCIGALKVVDVSNPALPAIVTSVAMEDVYAVAVDGTHAYVTGVSYVTGYGLHVFDISSPISPALVGSVPTYSTLGLTVAGNLAYLAGIPGIEVVDISNPTSPAIIGGTGLPDVARRVTVSSNYAYLTGFQDVQGDELQVVDISNPASPAIIGTADLEQAGKVVVASNLAYVACEPGLRIVDVSNPASPIILGSVTLPSMPIGLAVAGNYVYVANNGYLLVVDVSNPAAPIIVGSVLIPGGAWDVAVDGNFAFVVNHSYIPPWQTSLRIVDVSNPTVPVIVGSTVMPGRAFQLAVAGKYAYVVDGGDYPNTLGGIHIVDISKSALPVIVSSIEITGAVEVAVAGDLACVVRGGPRTAPGLSVLDVSNPASPVVIGSIHAYYARNVAINGIYAYISSYYGVRVIDISSPASPAFVGGANILSYPYVTDVAVANGLVYLPDYNNGVLILPTQCQSPSAVETPLSTAGRPQCLLAQNHPNPFVAEGGPTAIGFTLGEQAHTKLRVFDASGRLVRQLIDDELGVGPHTTQWDGRNEAGANTASGIYYYRLEAGEFSEARALVKLR